MFALTITIQAFLFIWFLGCTTTYKLGSRLLVEGMGIRSAEFIVLCLYGGGLVSFYCYRPVGKWVLFSILAFWFVVQFLCHWRYTIFGASRRKLDGYNECFRNTVRIFPMSDKRLIPDMYHIVLHVLILTNIVLCLTADL